MTKANWTGSVSGAKDVPAKKDIYSISEFIKSEFRKQHVEVKVTDEMPLVKDRSGILHVIDPSQHKFNIKIVPESALTEGVVLLDKMLAGIKANRSALSLYKDHISFTANPKELVEQIKKSEAGKTSAARG